MDQASTRPASGLPSDLALAGLVVAVIVMMALPLPPWILDVLVAFNISMAVILLLVALFVPSPLAFSTFPSVLLVTTLFRISLNVATTRQILLHAHAGDIINAFGRLVVGGSLVVGLVVFLIITVVQFIVIAKGAERVAEVGARFTLDALPGKQMSIDADLRAGVISQPEALVRRRELVQESQFYGAMDGAMKFVKGDAVAGIVIVLVNLVGGIAIGTLTMDLGLGPAVQRYSVLSIGDGLVTQIPALFVSIAAGIAITRSAPDSAANLGQQIARQLAGQPRALFLAAGVMALFALVPGFPTITFLALSATATLVAWRLSQGQQLAARAKAATEVPSAARDGETAAVMLLDKAPTQRPGPLFSVQIAPGLVDDWSAAGIDRAIALERLSLRQRFGLPFPGVSLVRSDAQPERGFCVVVQDLKEEGIVVPEGNELVLGSPAGSGDASPGPALLAPCHWRPVGERSDANADADADAKDDAEVLQGAAIMARVLATTMQRHASALVGVQEVRQALREIEWRYGDLTREAQVVLPLPKLAELLAALAREAVPLNDLPSLLQAIVTHGPGGGDTNALYEAARMSVARAIVARLLSGNPARLAVTTLDRASEAALRAALVMRPDGPVLGLSPEQADAARKALVETIGVTVRRGVLALPADLRRASSRLFRAALPNTAFLSHEEIAASGVQPDIVASVALGPAA